MTMEKMIRARRILIIIQAALFLIDILLMIFGYSAGIVLLFLNVVYYILYEIITSWIVDFKYIEKDERYRHLFNEKFSVTGFRENFLDFRIYKHSKEIGDKPTIWFYRQEFISLMLVLLQILSIVIIFCLTDTPK